MQKKWLQSNLVVRQVADVVNECDMTFQDFLNQVESHEVALERRTELDEIIKDIELENDGLQLTFICTHNSRRSQFTQVWAQVFATYLGLDNVSCFSGGTEETRVYKSVISTISEQGLSVSQIGEESDNPKFKVLLEEYPESELTLFSKCFDDEYNPSSNFYALMTCDHAYEACPFVPGALKRISLQYTDPKFSDGSEQEESVYYNTSLNIAAEMHYLIKGLKQK